MAPRSRPSREITEAARRHRATAERVLDRTAVGPTRRAYAEEHHEATRALSQVLRGRGAREATASDVRQAHEVMRRRMSSMLDRMGQSFQEVSRDTMRESARSTARFITAAEGDRGTILHDDEMISRIVQARSYGIDRSRSSAMSSLRQQMDHQLSSTLRELTARGATRSELITAASDVTEENWWRVERTLRTETSAAYNAAQAASIRALREDYPDMMQRWTEMVNDLTGTPLDNRVGQDSLVLHGQVAHVGGLFVMPPDARAPSGMVGETWSQPPNRPNDRAVLMPWRPGWNVPAWRYDGRRISMR